MSFFDLHKVIIKPAGKSLKTMSVFNPLTIHKKGNKDQSHFCVSLGMFFLGHYMDRIQRRCASYAAFTDGGLTSIIGGLCYVLFFLIKGERWPKEKNGDPLSY